MPRKLLVCYVLPSRYDDEGYVQRYWRNVLPSNTLACLKSLTCALAGTEELGRDVDLTVEIYDDSVQRVPIEWIVRRARKSGAQLLVGLVGVQSNQFPRAADIALAFREHDVPVMIGGFHVSGVLALFGEPSPELQRMLEHGVTLVRGEAEAPGALAGILRDALDGALRPLYNITELPDLSHAAVPQQDEEYLKRFVWKNMGTIDTSRGCPFNCSFCTIINVQGRTMRFRSAKAILRSIEENHAHGVNVYFFTDDNFARSAIWETLFDGMIALRAQGIVLRFMMQVDTQAWRIPHFIEKAQAAGCYLVFIGMETLNPENIAAAGKRQNKVGQYAAMVEAWHQADILVEVGYIIGFPHDTVESVRRDITMLQHEIKVDEAAFFMLTPLPGSRDHFNMVQQGTPLDADLNNYDSFHETFRHAKIPAGQWHGLYREAWATFYSKDNIVNMMLRVPPALYWRTLWLCIWNRYATLFGTHPMVTGFLRLKDRKGRRPTFAAEGRFTYARRRTRDLLHLACILVQLFFEFQEIWLLTRPKRDVRWTVLADIRRRWAEAQQRIADSTLAGHCDVAAEELRALLGAASARLHELSSRGSALSGRARRRVRRLAGELDAYIASYELQMPSWRTVLKGEEYIREHLVTGYEELAIRSVATRRQINAYYRDCLQRLKTGRILTANVSMLPRALAFEFVFALRFAWAFFHHV